ncbi:dynein axonemal heavy chain 1 [Antennarius striatus]|uniref:dynein axonemal heavy chain 1 n=1 Tax=Antennarius striatus TaxID=241820 RepID=UPI0035B2DACA
MKRRRYLSGSGPTSPHPPCKPPDHKPPFKHQSCAVGPEIRQRSEGRPIHEVRDLNTAKGSKTSPDQLTLTGQSHPGASSESQTSDFWRSGCTPKIQMPYQTIPGQIPRKLAIERRRREYLLLNFEQLLADKGIDSDFLMPKCRSNDQAAMPDNPVASYLPLEMFDNEDYDCRTPEDWLLLGNDEQLPHRKPIPAKALLSTSDNYLSAEDDPGSSSLKYSWHLVDVLDYSKEKYQYLVQKVHPNIKTIEDKRHPVCRKEHKKGKYLKMLAGTKHWVPRIRLLFSAEDPRVFVERIQFALRLREKTEALIFHHLSVDCMPICEGTPSLDSLQLQSIKRCALSAPGLRLNILEKCIEDLEKEIKLEFARAMNSIIFEKVVMNHPDEFSHITLPQKDPVHVPQKGCFPIPDLEYKKNQAAFVFRSLLTKPEVICVLSEVGFECNKVATMRLFNVTFIKPVTLDKFEDMQSQVHTQISLFLRETWVVTLSNNIRSNLANIGKGAYNVNQSSWEMYKISKMSRLMTLVHFKLQDSLRFLVRDSLISLTQLLLDACDSLLNCPQDLVWGNNLITSPYKPKRNPLFQVDLVLDQTGVHYSTPLENFQTSVVDLFDKGILATYNILQLDKLVMHKLFIGDNPLLESVNLWEPEVNELREKVHNALMQAAIPLRAYAAEYEKYLELNNTDIKVLLNSHTYAELTFQEVKEVVEHYQKQVEILQLSLPSSIVIGVFIVRVEPVRLTLSKKMKAAAKAMLDHFVVKLRKQVDYACEECDVISRKLRERPNSIEELTELREWMKQIPEAIRRYKEHIAKTLLDYDRTEEFYYCLSNEDMKQKSIATEWPQRIINQMEALAAQHVEDEERFRKIHLVDQNNFQDHLDSLQMLVAGLAGHGDIDRAHEVVNEMRRINKQLKDCQMTAENVNKRQNLFGLPVTNYDRLKKLVKDFQPFKDLWTTASDWLRWQESWLADPLTSIDPEQLERIVTDSQRTIQKCVKQFKGIPGCEMVATVICSKIEDFLPYVPLIRGLRNLGMRSRHWEMLSEVIQIRVKPKASLTLSRCVELGLQNHLKDIARVAEIAEKENAIEQALEKMEQEWSTVSLDVLPYKETGNYILKNPDKVSQLLDDHIVTMQSMSFSPFKKHFEDRISTWERKLTLTRDVLEEWLICQRCWLHLEPIFNSDDINQELPVERQRYQSMEKRWKLIMKRALNNKKVMELCSGVFLLHKLKECNTLLEQVQKGLSEYLERKRESFPRFHFMSDDEVMEILSQNKNLTALQPHVQKCFENIAQVRFQSDLQVTHMYSEEGEEVKLLLPVWPTGNVEAWFRDVETSMEATLRDNIDRSLKAYHEEPRKEWVLSWPGQVVLAGCLVFWTAAMSEALEQGDLNKRLYPQLQTQLGDLVQLLRGHLSNLQRAVLSALIVIEVHAKDVAASLVEQEVSGISDFEWISQLRYYWTDDDLYIHMLNTKFSYGYEYLGNSGRLVITPLTERCFLTLTGALNLKYGGAPSGPTGTGKTETIKDLGKALAVQTVVINCSNQLNFLAVGRILKGLASSGAWVCFDEFKHIDVEVLSVAAQQIRTIQRAQQQQAERFVFEGTEIPLVSSCAVFMTTNLGYAGCTEMPDNLKALFRPVAMMVPDYAVIADVSLLSNGFIDAKLLSQKITTAFKLSSELLSFQDHYDFGIRAMKTVISAAGDLKRENPNMNEELICVRAIQQVSLPKLVQDDLKLFNSIISDLFSKTKWEKIKNGTLEDSIHDICAEKNLKDVDGFVNKCVQLYETTVLKRGVMLVGPSGSGKTQCYQVLAAALTALKGQPSASGGVYESVQIRVVNPKSVTVGQLHGEYDSLTHEWTDGILSSLIRGGAASTDKEKEWYIFDGPVDPVWAENVNAALDDNKKLCLGSGEIIQISDEMTMMFEVQDLAVASPSTVSRCGVVYLEPSMLGLIPFTACWLERLPEALKPYTGQLQSLFSRFLQDSITFVRTSVNEVITSLDSNLTCSLLKLLDCLFNPFSIKEGKRSVPQNKLDRLKELVEPWFFFCLVWSVGSTGDSVSCKRFSAWLKSKMAEEKIGLCFPEEGLVYDYRLDDAGITDFEADDEDKDRKVQWVGWMDDAESVTINPKTNLADVIVPTAGTVRMSFVMDLLLTNKKTILCVGPTGTGKTVTISAKLLRDMPSEYITHSLVFSAHTSANHTQDYIESKLEKRPKSTFGPPKKKHFIFFIDDLNMSALETCGAQPPIELLRQWMDHRGWYDRKQIGTFKYIVDINFICAMGPPGGSRNPITQRFTRHFNILSITEIEDASKKRIFSSILGSWMGSLPAIQPLNESLIDASVRVYSAITSQLLPTPSKPHYTFSLRDLSRVFQGMLMAEAEMIEDKWQLLQLWYHESCRVFQDRLVCTKDRDWFDRLLKDCIQEFDCSFEAVVPFQPVLYGDFTTPGADHKAYKLIQDKDKLMKVMEEYMDDYNRDCSTGMKLVPFMDAVEHVCRLSRILRQPLGNALLLGVDGSGRQSLTKLASYMSEYECFQIKPTKNYSQTEWRADIKSILLSAGLQNKQITFLFVDTQIKTESFLEDISIILSSGDVPNLYGIDEQERILTAMKPVVQDQGQQPTKANLMAAYNQRVRRNIHTVVCMSPTGEAFRAHLRQFPSLVTFCTIDWFIPWSAEALQDVATSFFSGLPELEFSPTVMEGLTLMCAKIHQSVAVKCEQYLVEHSRHNYVTLRSYMELLRNFSGLSEQKRKEMCSCQQLVNSALDKLLSTAEDVGRMQEELEVMKPLVEEAAKDTEAAVESLEKEKIVAEETRISVQAEEDKVSEKTCCVDVIAADVERDLEEALMGLNAALASLKSLKKNDINELQAMRQPPQGVKLVIEVICVMRGIKPKKVSGSNAGSKIDDYWEKGKGLLQDPGKFLESLLKYDKDNIPDDVIILIQPYIDNEEFQPATIAKVSKACNSICQWVRAIHTYHFATKAVEPKRQALREAQEHLVASQHILDDAKKQLAAAEASVASSQDKYQECQAKKDELDKKFRLCETRLVRGDKLVVGLADEKVRWKETLEHLDYVVNNVAGDVLLSAAHVTYLGPFTGEYRAALSEEWLRGFKELKIPHTDASNLITTFGDPFKIHSWQISGLPKDNVSVQNGVITQRSHGWPLFIDPQGRANSWIRNMERDNGLEVMKLHNRDFLHRLENAIRFGKPCLLEDVAEDFDPILEPVLLQQTFKQRGSTVLKLGDSVIYCHNSFKMYITTKLPNPHFSPEVTSHITLINFTMSPCALEDQLLSLVVAKECPDLEEAKSQLIISGVKMKQELKDIEDEILLQLSSTEGNPVDNEELIQVLETLKIKAGEIQVKMVTAEQTERDIDTSRLQFALVAERAQILFFCVSDLSSINPMYQYSLEWFLGIFTAAIAHSEKADTAEKRVANINEFFTFSLYSHICRGLFEKHRLMFAFLLCTRIMMNENKIDMVEWRCLLSGGMPVRSPVHPAISWLSEQVWQDIMALSTLDKFDKLAESFLEHQQGFKRIYDSNQPHREPLPGRWDTELDSFQKLLALRCLRPDCLSQGLQDFISAQLGQHFIEPQISDLSVIFKASSPFSPIIFVLSPGADPADDFYKFADDMQFSTKMSAISLGQGQGPQVETVMHAAMERGHWVFVQNCHVVPRWMPALERLTDNMDPIKVHKNFRLWLTSLPSKKFPVSILQNGSKMTTEPPRGIKANLQKTYMKFTDDFLSSSTKTTHFKSLLLSLSLFHGITLERRNFGPLGFNIPYEFSDGDLSICVTQLKMFLDEYQDVSYKVLKYTAGQIGYGCRVTDDWDRRCLLSMLEDFYSPAVLIDDHVYSPSGIYRQIDSSLHIKDYLAYIRGLPISDPAEIFGLHDNASISFAQNDIFALLGNVVRLQPGATAASDRKLEEVVEGIVERILEKIPAPFNIQEVRKKYPILYEESMNTVLIQEVIRYNKLLAVISQSLSDVMKALKGVLVMSPDLELMADSLFNNAMPDIWKAKAYPSLKPLASWVSDLLQRISFLQTWISAGIPPVFWISSFFFPQAFLTGILQNFARRSGASIETITFDFEILKASVSEITVKPVTGCYIHGLFLEGARWDDETGQLAESRPKELHTEMSVIWLVPKPNREPPTCGIYVCPVYKTLSRAGTPSTAGHSSNYIMAVELPTGQSQRHWIRRGVALICALD